MLLASAGYWSAFVFAALSPRRVLPHGWMALAVALTVGGTAFRLWAVRTLGAYFTRTVQVSDDQRVVEAGPYRWLRHPSYTGSLVAAAGVGLALGNWGSLALIVVPLSASLLYRIKVEERALAASLGDPYRSYCGRTKRLVPLVY
jgi:protein-S-isoprenylcysteine O-methyltransferase Ste14